MKNDASGFHWHILNISQAVYHTSGFISIRHGQIYDLFLEQAARLFENYISSTLFNEKIRFFMEFEDISADWIASLTQDFKAVS